MKKEFIIHPLILITGFCIGWFVHKAHYADICMDLGGGKNPGEYPICVVEK